MFCLDQNLTTFSSVHEDWFSLAESSSLFEIFSCLILQFLGLHFGTIGLYCLVFLFLPVARGSVLLRLIDIPFEHAIRYHVWLGNLTMLLFTLHGLFYVIECDNIYNLHNIHIKKMKKE